MATEILAALLFGGAVLGLTLRRRETPCLKPSLFALWAGLLLLSALSLRLYLGLYSQGFTSDLNNFKSWGYALAQTPLNQVYRREDLFLDYPPGYLYILLLLEKLRGLLGLPLDCAQYTLLLKLPSILADLFCGLGLLLLGWKKLGEKPALLLAAAYLFCPVVIINSAQWGQVDSFCTAILFLSVLLLYREWYVPSAVLYGLSVACKPQMLIFAPVYLFFTIKQKQWVQLLLGILSALGAILLTAGPFTEGFHFLWLLKRYQATLDYYHYYSINAYNFWALLGWNWRNLPEGLSLQGLTVLAPVLATLLCGLFLFSARRRDALLVCPVVLMTVMYMFGIKMHERYLYPAFLFLLLACIYRPDRRFLYAFGASAVFHYLNVAHVLYLFREKGGNYDPNAPVVRWLAAGQLLALGYALYAPAASYLRGPLPQRPARSSRWLRPAPADARFTWLDWAALSALTAAYAAVAFWGLGSHEMPTTAWAPAQGEAVVLHSEEPCDAVYYLPGIAPDSAGRAARVGVNIRVESSADGRHWVDCGNLSQGGTYVFTWAQLRLSAPGTYIRLTPEDGMSVLYEAGLKLEKKVTFASLTARGAGAKALIDEQDQLSYFTTYRNSAYFDEIYHARTAYEHILGLEPYENTHPPLGKYIISLGIRLFGLNPFGWRCAGTLFGVLMLPVLYHLLKQLFGKTSLCSAGLLLFAFDFMHFTQTRIATIDTYAVFFLLLMYDAMVCFLRRDLTKDSWGKLLPPLLACGIFTGLGVASKWTAAYGALGLAVLFFGKLFLTFRDSKKAGAPLDPLKKRALFLCLWCCLFFGIIPLGLYFAAYLPLCTLPHNVQHLWGSFWNYQVNMFQYHSRLVADHYFASPWYEWPLDIRPIWYFSGDPADFQGHYSTISAFGNPLLWWAGIPALFSCVLLWLRERKLHGAVALCGFLSVYLPWVLVPRLTFIYHYFTAVPFLVVALCGIFARLPETRLGALSLGPGKRKISPAVLIPALFTGGCLLLFALYFPVISGLPVSKAYTDALRLFPSWYF